MSQRQRPDLHKMIDLARAETAQEAVDILCEVFSGKNDGKAQNTELPLIRWVERMYDKGMFDSAVSPSAFVEESINTFLFLASTSNTPMPKRGYGDGQQVQLSYGQRARVLALSLISAQCVARIRKEILAREINKNNADKNADAQNIIEQIINLFSFDLSQGTGDIEGDTWVAFASAISALMVEGVIPVHRGLVHLSESLAGNIEKAKNTTAPLKPAPHGSITFV